MKKNCNGVAFIVFTVQNYDNLISLILLFSRNNILNMGIIPRLN